MALTRDVAITIVARCKRDPHFKREVLKELRQSLAEDSNKEHRKKLDRAIAAIERLK